MTTTVELRTPRDTFASEVRPTTSFQSETRLNVRGSGTSAQRLTYLASGAFPTDVNISSAKLRVVVADPLTGSRTLTVKRITEPWAARDVTWQNRPAVSATNAATAVVGAVAGNTLVEFNVTAIAQEAANGVAFYGFRIESSTDNSVLLVSADAANEGRHPYVEIIYSTAPTEPTDLLPTDGMIVPLAKPVLYWSYGDPARPGSYQSAAQVQIANDDLFTVSVFDTAKMTALPAQYLDTATTAYAGAPSASMRYWRVKVWNEDDIASEWSDAASFQYVAPGVLAIVNPPVGTVVNDLTPLIDWTFSTETQRAFHVFIHNSAANGGELFVESGRIESAVTQWQVPEKKPLKAAGSYVVTIRVWDTRERQPGQASYVEATRAMTYASVAGITAVTSYSAVANGAAVTLQWNRATVPDYWAVVVDGVVEQARIPGGEPYVSGTTYRHQFWRATPRVAHTYEVQAVVNTAGVMRHSTGNPSASVTTEPIGIVLVDEDTDQAVMLAGQDSWGAEVAETSTVYTPIGNRTPILVTDVVRGYEGTVTGTLAGHPAIDGVTAQGLSPRAERDLFLDLRTPGRTLRLVIGDRNLPVRAYALTALPTPTPGDVEYTAGFSFFQTGEFEIPWDG